MSIVRCYYGKFGQGKTYNMIKDALAYVRERPGVMVYTNMSSLKFPESVYIHHVEQMAYISNGIFLLDEAGVLLNGRDWQAVSSDLLNRMFQVRKAGLRLWYTVQRTDAVDVNLRETTDEVIECMRMGGMMRTFTHAPKDPKSGKFRGYFIDKSIYPLYDTHEELSKHQGSLGSGLERDSPQSFLARKRSEHEEGLREAAQVAAMRPLLVRSWDDILSFESHSSLVLTSEAKAAYRRLCDRGAFLRPRNGKHWAIMVREEIERVRWLAKFGIPAHFPRYWITPKNPWLDGYDPHSQKMRWDELKEERDILALAMKEAKQRGRVVPSAR